MLHILRLFSFCLICLYWKFSFQEGNNLNVNDLVDYCF